MTPQVALPPADREMNLAKIKSPGMALGEGSALFSSRPQQTAVPSDFNPQDWIFPAATASRDSPEGGEALPLSLYPQQWGAPSAFTPQACMPPTLMDMNFGFTPASVFTGPCGGGVAGWAGAAVGACVGGAAVAVVSGFGAAAAGVTGWTVGAAVALGAGRGLGCRRRRRGGDLRCEDGRLLRGSGGLAGQEHQRQKQQKRESDDFDVTYAGKRRFTFYGM